MPFPPWTEPSRPITPYVPPAPAPKYVTRDPSEPYPATLATVDHISPDDAAHYVRQFDGSYRLAWVNQRDMELHLHLVGGKNAPRIVPDGQTAAEYDEQQAADLKQRADVFQTEFARQIQTRKDTAEGQRDAAAAAERARLDGERQRDQDRLDKAHHDTMVRARVAEEFAQVPGVQRVGT